eukprot:CAMPEP_0178972096 /NCGR_PEP_ID=MMETSP0789-20121207/20772_1 /TAXON_ID=3005 /ORGANISM="Rhizosolenia setigera, Strain CCMP 1694" /LENGTH=415 /DNA_ID=CAMNT_0020659403 /DNA_START=82 /DNA_END=1329 /DNA_ORIENTATION=+
MNSAIIVRASILAATLSLRVVVLGDNSNDDGEEEKDMPIILTLVFLGVAVNVVSIYLIWHIRTAYIVGPAFVTEKNLSSKDNVNMIKDKVVLITGSNAGIGKETAIQLLLLGASKVIFACRNEERAKAAIKDVIAQVVQRRKKRFSVDTSESKEENLEDRCVFLQMDLSNFSSIRKAVKEFLDMGLPLHVLINNAGIMMGERKENADGYELTMASNHLGHFLLTNLLLPKLRETTQKMKKEESPSYQKQSKSQLEGINDKARVINVSSSTYALSSKIDLDDIFCEKTRKYSLFGQYSQTKLANILFTAELDRRETNDEICYVSLHPGLVRTDVTRNMQWWLRFGDQLFGFIIMSFQKYPEAGAFTSVYCAASPDVLSLSGGYFVNSEIQDLEKCAIDPEGAKKLWELSEKLVRLN